MGSFSIKCGASRQTIAEGDACWVIPIRQQSTFHPVAMTIDGRPTAAYGIASSTCYTDAFWSPISDFIEGTYADYGYVLPRNTPQNLRAMRHFLTEVFHGPVILEGKNPYHDKGLNLPELISLEDLTAADYKTLLKLWETVWEVASKHRLFDLIHGEAPRPIQFCVVHHRAFGELIQLATAHQDWGGVSYEWEAYLGRKLDECAADTSHRKLVDTPDALSDKEFKRCRLIHLAHQLTLDQNGHPGALLRPHQDFITRALLSDVSRKALAKKLYPCVKGIYALAGMNLLDLKLTPLEYGGQDYDNSEGARYARFIATVSETIVADRARHYDE